MLWGEEEPVCPMTVEQGIWGYCRKDTITEMNED